MIVFGTIGPIQIIIVFFSLILPVALFFIGFYLGKKSGYSKRIEEEQTRK